MGFIYIRHYNISEYDENHTINITNYLNFNIADIKGWSEDFIISGSFIHNLLINKPNIDNYKQIDFDILTQKGFHTILNFFDNYFTKLKKFIKYHVTQFGIEIEVETENWQYLIKLNNKIEWTIENCIDSYEIDYNKCYFDGKIIRMSPLCSEIINKKKIYLINSPINYSQILYAINNGYSFKKEFLKDKNIINIPLEILENDDNNSVENKKKYIGQSFHILSDQEKEKLHQLIIDNQEIENNNYNRIFTINNSLDNIKKILPLLYKNHLIYKNTCYCDMCESMYDEPYMINIQDSNSLTFDNIVKYLYINKYHQK